VRVRVFLFWRTYTTMMAWGVGPQSEAFELVFEEFMQGRAEKFYAQGSLEDHSDDDQLL
jgi:hypothetical protein